MCQWCVAIFCIMFHNNIMEGNNVLDPRQQLATSYYKDPKSPTFGNLKRSMMRAGFAEKYATSTYAKKIDWIVQARNTVHMIEKSEKNLTKVLEYPIDFEDKTKFNSDMIKNTINVSMFALKSLASAKYNEEEKEQKPNVQINILNYNDKEKNNSETVIDVKETE